MADKKPKEEKKEGREYKTVHDPRKDKKIVITTDGSKIQVQNVGMSNLEMEMVFIKALKALQGS